MIAPVAALALLGLLGFALPSARAGEHGRHGLAMGLALGLCAAFLPFHLGPASLGALAAFRGPASFHAAAGVGGVLLAFTALPLGLRALAYRRGRLEDPRWARRHKALARPAAILLAATALLGLLQAGLRALVR